MQREKEPYRTPKILVVEDQRIYYEWLRFMCVEPEYTWVDNGKKGVDEIIQKRDYDAIVMNLEMPVMHGCDAALHIRRLGYTGPIIGWSSYSKFIAEEPCLKAGMDVFVERAREDGYFGAEKIVAYLTEKGII